MNNLWMAEILGMIGILDQEGIVRMGNQTMGKMTSWIARHENPDQEFSSRTRFQEQWKI